MLALKIKRLSLNLFSNCFNNSGKVAHLKGSPGANVQIADTINNIQKIGDVENKESTPIRDKVIKVIQKCMLIYISNDCSLECLSEINEFINENGHRMVEDQKNMFTFMDGLKRKVLLATSPMPTYQQQIINPAQAQLYINKRNEASEWLARCFDLFNNLTPSYKEKLAKFDFSVESI